MILPLLNFCWKLFYTVSRPRQSDAKKASSAWKISLAFQGHRITEDPGIASTAPGTCVVGHRKFTANRLWFTYINSSQRYVHVKAMVSDAEIGRRKILERRNYWLLTFESSRTYLLCVSVRFVQLLFQSRWLTSNRCFDICVIDHNQTMRVF